MPLFTIVKLPDNAWRTLVASGEDEGLNCFKDFVEGNIVVGGLRCTDLPRYTVRGKPLLADSVEAIQELAERHIPRSKWNSVMPVMVSS